MLTVSPCESLCFVAWRSCLPGICHHFTFQKGRGKAGVVCVLWENPGWSPAVWWLGREDEGPALVPAWTKSWLLPLRVLRQGPGQDWGISVLLGEAEGLCGSVSVLEAAQEYTVTKGLDLSSADKAFGFVLSPDSWALLCLSCAQFSPSPLEAAGHWLSGCSLSTCRGSLSRRTFPSSLLLTSLPLWELIPGLCFPTGLFLRVFMLR